MRNDYFNVKNKELYEAILNDGTEILYMYIRMYQNVEVVSLKHEKILDLISKIGGILKFIFMFIKIVKKLKRKNCYKELSEDLVEFERE